MQVSHLYGKSALFFSLCEEEERPDIYEGVKAQATGISEQGIPMSYAGVEAFLTVRGNTTDSMVYEGRVVREDDLSEEFGSIAIEIDSCDTYDYALVYLNMAQRHRQLGMMREYTPEEVSLLRAVSFVDKIGWTFLALARECPMGLFAADGRLTDVLEFRRSNVVCKPYELWRAGDMERCPDRYLQPRNTDHRWLCKEAPSAVLRHVPADWLGLWVSVLHRNGREVTGQLVEVSSTHALVKEHPWDATVTVCDDVLWVSCEGDGPSSWSAEKFETLFRTAENAPMFISPQQYSVEVDLTSVLAPVAVRVAGMCVETGNPVILYGTACLDKPGSRLVTSKWFNSYGDAQNARWELMAALSVYDVHAMLMRLWEYHCSAKR